MPEIPAEISIETTGWLITLGVAIVFLALVVIEGRLHLVRPAARMG
jgi:hypothetical protein